MTNEEKKAIEYIKRQKQGIPPNGKFIIRKTDIQIVLNLIEKQNKEIEKKDKVIDKMAEQLTTPIHSKEWVINYYKEEVEEK